MPSVPSVLIASELKDLLPPQPVPEARVRWIAAGEETPGGDYVGIVPLLSRRLGAGDLAALPQLKVIANCAVGIDNVDVAAALVRGIVVTNTPDVLTEATADLTWALILAVARRLKEGAQLIAEQRWHGWNPTELLGLELRDRTLGLLGAGRIGQAVGRRAFGFSMRVLYHARTPKPDFEASWAAQAVELDALLGESDVLSVHLPSSDQTRDLLGDDLLARLRPGAILINTARGDIIDQEALLRALRSGHLGGVGLDVYPREPEVHPELVAHPRVVVLPHIGSATWETRRAMAALAVRNLRAVLRGERALTPVR